MQQASVVGADPLNKIVIGVADVAVTTDPTATLITYALGSCIGVTVWDPEVRVGGLLHFMLPTADGNDAKVNDRPAMFGDVAVPRLFKSVYDLGGKKDRLIVCAAGGAEVMGDDGHFKIGSRNRTILRKLFWKNNVLLAADETGGMHSRTLTLRMHDGAVSVRSQGTERVLWQG
jgi:chemotaxis protein CheD